MASAAAAILRTYSLASLQQIARQRGIPFKSESKETLVKRMAPTLFDSDEIAAALADLEPSERTVLHRLLLMGGDVAAPVLRRFLQQAGEIDPPKPDRYGYAHVQKGSARNRNSTLFEDVVARLTVLGLVYTAGPDGYTGASTVDLHSPGRRLFVPEPIRRHLPAFTVAPVTTGEPERVRLADPSALLRDLYAVVQAADQEPIPLTTRGQIVKKALVRIDEKLRIHEGASDARSEDDLHRLSFLRAIAEDLHLLVQSTGMLVPGDDALAFLRRPPAERRLAAYAAWQRTARWCELFHVEGLQISAKGGLPRGAPSQVIAARQRVVAELRALPAGQWIPFGHLVERLRHQAYELLLPRQWDFGWYSYGTYSWQTAVPNPYQGHNALGWTFRNVVGEEAGWDQVEGRFVGVVIEALGWLGAVELGGPERSTTAFRVTAEGAPLLRGEAPPRPEDARPATSRVIVQPNFQIFAFEPVGEDVLFQLDRIAERVRAEQVVEYRLTRDSVYRALHKGLDAAGIATFLESVCAAPLPQNVRRSLEDWGAQHDRVVVRRAAALLHATDQSALDALLADQELGPLVGRRIAPTAALVPHVNLRTLSDRLLARGELPAMTEGAGASQGFLLTVDHDGRIAFRQRMPSIYALRDLREIADEEPDGAMRLSAASLRRAARSELAAEDIVATLERYHAGPLPAEVAAMVRRWAKDWGRGALVEAMLLQVQTAEILSDLFADPEVGPVLRRLPGADTVALVRSTAVERVRSALDARGMSLDSQLMR